MNEKMNELSDWDDKFNDLLEHLYTYGHQYTYDTDGQKRHDLEKSLNLSPLEEIWRYEESLNQPEEIHTINVQSSELRSWVNLQKDLFKEGKLDAYHEIKLETIPGWIWGDKLRPNENESYRMNLAGLQMSMDTHYARGLNEYNYQQSMVNGSVRGLVENIKRELKRIEQWCDCENVYCSTCGGKMAYMSSKINRFMRIQMYTVVGLVDYKEIKRIFGHYSYIFFEENPIGYEKSRIREVKRLLEYLDEGDFNIMHEQFVFKNRKYRTSENNYLRESWEIIFENAITHMCKLLRYRTRFKECFFESMIILLGEDSIKYPKLVEFGIKMSKESDSWKKVMYNSLRENVKEVRDYRGDGDVSYDYPPDNAWFISN